ncbi:MAG: 16S rRNA (uracil(1498)-N(3))-methyltransferase [Phaeovulum sp.]|uniref:16S rRNA (uracil(1498)-N(3))-methyltransferase n=1 Tax=Phaeovulum sp. TaxID=2934796 RepID=UPI00272FC4DC|nr:16S rRNA (uracil(1498)-N(3))-methyltransferase [Phaeovulum sp.]MDP2063507.1 16S rRNA (uracil(1498)-N(3))-methyltransferase [Phaeovulum sp.]
MAQAKIRLYLDQPLAAGQPLHLSQAQAQYLFAVMRLGVGDKLLVFNGQQGEWLAEVAEAAKRGGVLSPIAQTAPQQDPPDLWLLFAPIKKARTDFIVEKATELGAARIVPVQTDFTNSERIRQDRLQAHAVEAAEQCGGTFVPEVAGLVPLSRLLDDWNPARRILWADESRLGVAATLAGLGPGPWAVLVGPEGGFSAAERARLAGLGFVTPVSLGPRILRADTAACAALTLWQAALGDWR